MHTASYKCPYVGSTTTKQLIWTSCSTSTVRISKFVITDRLQSYPYMSFLGFFYSGIHVSPTKAVGEIGNLTVVHAEALNLWGDNIIILGDFNADCSYVSASKWPLIALHDETKYYWPLDSDTDSTVATSSCAYDRCPINAIGVFKSICLFALLSIYGLLNYCVASVNQLYQWKIYSSMMSTYLHGNSACFS